MSATTTLCRCGSGLPVDDDDQCIACCPRTFHPTHSDVMRHAVASASIGIAIRAQNRRYVDSDEGGSHEDL